MWMDPDLQEILWLTVDKLAPIIGSDQHFVV
jgi:hypothetical protein